MDLVTFDANHWWFITKDGWSEFKNTPVAQGYEIARRHPAFPWLKEDNIDGGVIRVHGLGIAPKPTWLELGTTCRRAFAFDYKRDMERMGLVKLVLLGEKAISFDCRHSSDEIYMGIIQEMEALKLFPPSHTNYRDRQKLDPTWVVAEFADKSPCPWAVTLRLDLLIQKLEARTRRNEPIPFDRRDLFAVIRTFLRKDATYLAYAKLMRKSTRLTARQLRSQKAKDFAKPLSPSRRRRRDPIVLPLACIAWDWQQAGHAMNELSPWLEQKGINLQHIGAAKRPRWHGYLSAMRAMHSLFTLSKPR